MGSEHETEFDEWLCRHLHQRLDEERGPRPRPAEARYSAASRTGGTNLFGIRSGVLAALGAKAAVGGAAVALAAGAVAGTAATGSVNPVNWGQHIVQVVNACKHPAEHIGECVSDAAQQHGQQVRAEHSEAVEKQTASPSPKPGQREGQDNRPSPDAAAASHGQGSPPASPGAGASHGDGTHGHGQPTATPSTRG